MYICRGSRKLTKSQNHFSKTLLTSADLRAGCIPNNGKNSYSVQILVAQVKDSSQQLISLLSGEPPECVWVIEFNSP